MFLTRMVFACYAGKPLAKLVYKMVDESVKIDSRWTAVLPEPPIEAPQLAGDYVVVATRTFIGWLSIATGEWVGQHQFEGYRIVGMVVADEEDAAVVVSLMPESLLAGGGRVCLVRRDGTMAWQWPAETQQVSKTAVVGEFVYVVSGTGQLLKLAKGNGALVTTISLGDIAPSSAAPLVTEESVYVPTRGQQLLALTTGGMLQWTFTDEEAGSWLDRTPLLVGEQLLVVDRDGGQVIALSTASGKRRWVCMIVLSSTLAETPLAVAGQGLWIAAKDGLHQLTLFGNEQQQLARQHPTQPVVVDGLLFVTGHDRLLQVLDGTTGTSLGEFEAARRFEVGPAIRPLIRDLRWLAIMADRGGTVTAVEIERGIDKVALRDKMVEAFDLSELGDVTFELDVKFDDVAGERLTHKVRELIEMMERNGRLADLLEVCRKLRPNLTW